MKATDLRIGNLLEYAGQPVYVLGIQQATEFMGDSHHLYLGYYTDSVGFERHENDQDLRPLPLTEEWLIKFGFEKDYDGCPTLLILKNRFQYSHNTKELLWQQTPHNDWSGFPCSYVHTFQNIFYALTGQELTLAPPQR